MRNTNVSAGSKSPPLIQLVVANGQGFEVIFQASSEQAECLGEHGPKQDKSTNSEHAFIVVYMGLKVNQNSVLCRWESDCMSQQIASRSEGLHTHTCRLDTMP